MLNFVPVDRLKAGMVLGRDIFGVNTFTSKLVLLRANQELTSNNIIQMKLKKVSGAYIKTKSIYDVESFISKAVKENMLGNIKTIFDLSYNLCDKVSCELYIGAIKYANNIIGELVDNITSHPNLYVDLSSLRIYDDYTYNHSLGVTILSIAIGNALGLEKKDLVDLGLSAILHDVGKTHIPLEIISKPSKLDDEEFEMIKKHVEIGGKLLLKNKLIMPKIYRGVMSHHEYYDGSGYPFGLKGKQIPAFGRIIACADVYDALTASRPYRAPSPACDVIEYVMAGAGIQFDLDVVNAFLKCISPYPIGACVVLCDGRIATIYEQNSGYPLRPKIVLFDSPYKVIDLKTDREYLNVTINGLYDN